MSKQGSIIRRKNLLLRMDPPAAQPVPKRPNSIARRKVPGLLNFANDDLKDITVLVVNSSREMAKEITLQLTLSIPGCGIMYAPSIELAKWILGRKPIDLVIASPLLPDGSITRLGETLEQCPSPPDVVVVGKMNVRSAEVMGEAGYEFAAMKKLGIASVPAAPRATEAPSAPRPSPINRRIENLGADIRNDLNNPLQEIVAMVFVAQAAHELSSSTSDALVAIDQAARNMSSYVNNLEDRIRSAVLTGAPER